MTKEEYRKASHFRDVTKMVAAPAPCRGFLILAFVSGMLRSGAENTYTADTAPDRQAVFLYLLDNHVK